MQLLNSMQNKTYNIDQRIVKFLNENKNLIPHHAINEMIVIVKNLNKPHRLYEIAINYDNQVELFYQR